MPAEPVKIPQNVYIEDQVVGPLTLRQILVMTGGGGFSYIIFALVQKSVGQMSIPLTVICWLPFAVCTAFALIKINGLSLMRIVFLLLERSYKSPVRTFAPRQGISINIRFSTPARSQIEEEKEKERQKKIADARSQTKIAELSRLIDRPISEMEETPVTATLEPEVAAPDVQMPVADETRADEEKPLALPVNPSRIAVDGAKGGTLTSPPLSDLSVFRDIFSPHNP